MSKIEIVILVIVVGVQVVRALKKRMEGEGSTLPETVGSRDEEPDWMAEEERTEPEVSSSREERMRGKASTDLASSAQPIILPLGRPLKAARPASPRGEEVRSRRELLRQRMLGKVILDPPPGAAMLRRFRP